MADDDELYNFAVRVKARAIRRCGELLQAIEKKHGANQNISTAGGTNVTRTSVAEDAGLSKRQKDTALRVASLPQEDFDEAVESETPPTITALAEQGTVKKATSPADIIGDRDPADFRAATEVLGVLNRFVELTQRLDPAAIVRGCNARERSLLPGVAIQPRGVGKSLSFLLATRLWPASAGKGTCRRHHKGRLWKKERPNR